MSDAITIGIDLGTSNSCVATVEDGTPRVLPNRSAEQTTASVVAFREDGSIAVGNQAKAQVILDPKHTVSSAKRLIGRFYFSEELRKARAICNYEIVPGENHSVRIQIRQEQFSLPEISAFVLKEMKEIAEHDLGREVTQAVITVPAYFNDNQRQATKDAGRIAGLDVLRILNEPTAAALAYGYGRDLAQKVVVYDFGGGTFDVSVLEIGRDVYEVLSTCGDTFLGGDDIDDRLIDLLADKVQAAEDINLRSDPVAFERLKQAAERAKIELSTNDSAHVSITDLAEVDGRQVGVEYTITLEEFNALISDLIQRTFKVCDEAMQDAGLTNRDIEAVVLVGGPTRLPTIREAVEAYFQKAPETEINPDEVVALGAAIHADSLASTQSSTYLLDVTPLTALFIDDLVESLDLSAVREAVSPAWRASLPASDAVEAVASGGGRGRVQRAGACATAALRPAVSLPRGWATTELPDDQPIPGPSPQGLPRGVLADAEGGAGDGAC